MGVALGGRDNIARGRNAALGRFSIPGPRELRAARDRLIGTLESQRNAVNHLALTPRSGVFDWRFGRPDRSTSPLLDVDVPNNQRVILADRRGYPLGRRETHLALAKARYHNIRAHILDAHLDARGRGRGQVAAELPLLYPQGRRSNPPVVRFPQAPEPGKTPRVRQAKTELHPFSESLPVLRYTRPA
jgi:hypothetical protein